MHGFFGSHTVAVLIDAIEAVVADDARASFLLGNDSQRAEAEFLERTTSIVVIVDEGNEYR